MSRYGVLALAESLDHVGPLARSSADAGIVLQAIAGFDPNDPTSLLDPVPDMLEGIEGSVKGVRIGLDEAYVSRDIDPELVEAVLAGVKALEGLGAEVVEVALPDMDPLVAAWPVLCSAEAVAAHAATYPSRRDAYGPWFRGWLDKGARVTGAEYAGANRLREAWRHAAAVWHNANSGREDGSAEVYIDGVRRAWMEGYAHRVTWEVEELRIGLGQRFAGRMDEVLILDAALDAGQVAALFEFKEPVGEML